jgi:methyl-accepting chemotaxis protein
MRREWLQQMNALGLSEAVGVRQELAKAMVELRELSLSLVDDAIREIDSSNYAYINSRDVALAERASQAITVLEDVVIQFDWQENVVGETTRRYRDVFSQTDAILRQIAAA